MDEKADKCSHSEGDSMSYDEYFEDEAPIGTSIIGILAGLGALVTYAGFTVETPIGTVAIDNPVGLGILMVVLFSGLILLGGEILATKLAIALTSRIGWLSIPTGIVVNMVWLVIFSRTYPLIMEQVVPKAQLANYLGFLPEAVCLFLAMCVTGGIGWFGVCLLAAGLGSLGGRGDNDGQEPIQYNPD